VLELGATKHEHQPGTSFRVCLLPLRTGGWPSYIGLDPADGAMYVPDNVDQAVSIFPSRHDHPPGAQPNSISRWNVLKGAARTLPNRREWRTWPIDAGHKPRTIFRDA
jgi:hypothetical protein